MKQYKLYKELALLLSAYKNCLKNNDQEWSEKHKEKIENLVDKCLPNGSGIDNGNKFNFEESEVDKLVIDSSYHVMDDGFYNGWIDFQVVVTPSLQFDFDLEIIGEFEDKEDIAEYLTDIYGDAFDK